MAVLGFIERDEIGWEGVINNGKYGEFMTKFSSLMFRTKWSALPVSILFSLNLVDSMIYSFQ